MQSSTDYVIVGSGLTGAVIGRRLTDAGRNVIVVDRRGHHGGNVHDHVHASGIRIHTYGPHYFRTNSDEIWEFVNRFSRFDHYEACIKSFVDSRHENWPIAASYIRRAIGEHWKPVFQGNPANFEEASLAMMPREIYEKFVKGYSEKQWGVPAHSLSAELAKRFDVREDDEPRLCRHRHQGIPASGYASLMHNMLHGVQLVLNCDYLQHRGAFPFRRKLIFTGPIDEFYSFDLGRLRYRGQQRRHTYRDDVDFVQLCGQVNYPDPAHGPQIRQLEWKHMMPAESIRGIRGTVLTQEITTDPAHPNEYEYPFPDRANADLYAKYRQRAEHDPKLLVCGRLGEYKYYDMDQAIARAIVLAERILEAEGNHRARPLAAAS
jgi:UDP-galactopyranose mutase